MKIKCNSYLVCKFDKANSIDMTDETDLHTSS